MNPVNPLSVSSYSQIAAIGLSGMAAAQTRLQSSASNLANMQDQAPLPRSGVAGPAPYVPTQVVTVSLSGGGVAAQSKPVAPAYSAGYAPGSPYADGKGMVATPNVDLASNLVDQAMSMVQFRASLAAVQAADDMEKTVLNIKA